eukprot:gene3591-4097_t
MPGHERLGGERQLHEREVEKTKWPFLEDKVKSCIKLFSDATNIVNIIGLFSRNEEADEISSSNLRYLLLPVFLGELTMLEISDERYLTVNTAKIYYVDFLQRCKDYSLSQKDLSKYIEKSEEKTEKSYQKSLNDRQLKIDRYKETKEIKNKVEILEKRIDSSPDAIDDKTEREYYLSWIRFWINESIEKLGFLDTELQILEHMKKLKLGEVKPPEKPKEREPIKPILITKDTLKNKVFGAGYPSLPSITPEQWMDRQIAEGKVVLDYNPGVNSAPTEKDSSDDDEESEEKLKKARDWDEWKDDEERVIASIVDNQVHQEKIKLNHESESLESAIDRYR